VTCSHVIKHVQKPEAFLAKLISLCRDFTVLACPFEEERDKLIPGHINSTSNSSLDRSDPVKKRIYDGMCWNQTLLGIFVFRGMQ